MSENKKKAKEKISLLISFLDEDNDDIINSIEHELLSLNEQENTILRQFISEIEKPEILDRANRIVNDNHFRFSENDFMHWLGSSEKNIFDLLLIIAKIEYPDLDCKSLKSHYNKMLKEVWASIPAESSSLDIAKLLKSFFFSLHQFKIQTSSTSTVKHIMINDVLSTKEINKLFLNIFYLCMAKDLGIPITPIMIDGLMILAFENKKPYNISFIDNEFLFFIDNTTLTPYPEAKLRERFNFNEDEVLPYTAFSKVELAVTLLNWLIAFYLKEKKEDLSRKIETLIEMIGGEV